MTEYTGHYHAIERQLPYFLKMHHEAMTTQFVLLKNEGPKKSSPELERKTLSTETPASGRLV